MNFYLSDLLLFPAVVQGFFLAYLLLSKTHLKSSANQALAVLLILSAIMMLSRIVYFRYPMDWPFQFLLIPDTIIFLFGPLHFLFFGRLLKVKKHLPLSALILPALHAISVAVFLISDAIFTELNRTGAIHIYYFSVEALGLISNTYFIFRCFFLLRAYKHSLYGFSSFIPEQFHILKWILSAFAIFHGLWWLGFINSYFMGFINLPNYNMIWIAVPATSYIIGYFMLTRPSFFIHKIPRYKIRDSKKPTTERLSQSMANATLNRLKKTLLENPVYLKSDITLKQLSELVGVSSNDLSWLLNEVCHKNFYDFINDYRIEAFTKKVRQGEHRFKTILALAMESGFRSKSTFNKAFSDNMGTTPSAFIKQFKKSKNLTIKSLAKSA